MAKAKSKKFILKHDRPGSILDCSLYSLNGKWADYVCHKKLHQWFGIELAPNKKKRVRITIEEVK